MRAVFLVNPASGNGSTGKKWPKLAARAAELGLPGIVVPEEHGGLGLGLLDALVVAEALGAAVAAAGAFLALRGVGGLMLPLTGVFIAGSLIGLISNDIDQRVEELQKGRSTVIEHDHTVILGWSERVPPIVSELTIANESRKHAAVVILAEQRLALATKRPESFVQVTFA